VALTKVFFYPDFLHFGQFYFYIRQVCSKWLANWASTTDALTLNGFTRNAKHGFDSWKLSNLAWNSSSSLTIYCGLQLLLREKHLFSLRSLTCDLDSLSLLSHRADALVTSVPLRCATAQNYQSICAVLSHSCALATFQIWYRIYIAYIVYTSLYIAYIVYTSCIHRIYRIYIMYTSHISHIHHIYIAYIVYTSHVSHIYIVYTSYIHRIVLSKRFTGCVPTSLWNCMRTKTNIFSMWKFLTGPPTAGDD